MEPATPLATPPTVLAPTAGRRTARRGLLLLLGCGLLAILLPLWLDSWVSYYAAELLRIRTAREAVAADSGEAAWLATDLARLAEPSRIARQTHANCALWHDLLRDLRDRLPNELWLTSLSVGKPSGTELSGREIQLSGAARNQAAIAGYLTAVGESPWIDTAEFQQSREETAGDEAERPLAFTLKLTLKRPLALPGEGTP